ncbi:unnamed protein product [Peniophora sp. CBMAI 1063]|nr:unnamed protein product [Peniophora sp. CBMAI 1063]
MLSAPSILAALAMVTSYQVALADVSLVVPGFDEQPLSVTELGVGADGRTTWALMPGVATNTDEDVGFFGTAILVEGPNDVHLVDSVPELSMTLDISCTIANGVADCVGNGYDSTPIPLGTQGPFLVQGNAAAATATAGSPSATGSTGANASAGSSASVTPAPTGSSASSSSTATSATPSDSSAGAKHVATTSGSLFIVIAALTALL